jgi:hypothetical protein
MSICRKIFLLSGCIIIIYSFCSALDNESLTIHPFLQSGTYCMDCHAKDNKIKITDTSPVCSQYCVTCHKSMENHHAINIKIKEQLPDEFVLTAKKRVACFTCHNIKSNRLDTSSWKAESLYEKVFKGEKKYKTYFLIKKNNEGQLCKTCH